MAWKCPDCGTKNDTAECICGYAFYKILGVKPDASEESVKQTYKYLLNVWQTDSISGDPLSQKKTEDRLKKINDAYNAFKDYTSNLSGAKRRPISIKLASLVIIIILFFAFLFMLLNTSREDKSREQTSMQQADKAKPYPPTSQVNGQNRPEEPKSQSPENLSQDRGIIPEPVPQVPGGNLSLGVNLERTEDNAIELVKKSHAFDHFFDVETIMKKWTDENSGKYQFIGWKAKKVDEQTYLVGYTASDGPVTKGYYFDVDFGTATVRYLGDYPELQKKYGIRYGQ